eukprot:2895432-Lingulodinium_polyedra.AAC.1
MLAEHKVLLLTALKQGCCIQGGVKVEAVAQHSPLGSLKHHPALTGRCLRKGAKGQKGRRKRRTEGKHPGKIGQRTSTENKGQAPRTEDKQQEQRTIAKNTCTHACCQISCFHPSTNPLCTCHSHVPNNLHPP